MYIQHGGRTKPSIYKKEMKKMKREYLKTQSVKAASFIKLFTGEEIGLELLEDEKLRAEGYNRYKIKRTAAVNNAYNIYREHTTARTDLPVDTKELERIIKDLKRETRAFREEAKRRYNI